MEIILNNFPKIMLDNDVKYLNLLEGFLNSIDEFCKVEVTKRLSGIAFRISPSIAMYSQHILTNLIDFHYMLKVKVEFSKSIRAASTIDYTINFEDTEKSNTFDNQNQR